MKNAQLVVRLTDEEYILLKAAAKREQRVLSDWVRLSLKDKALTVMSNKKPMLVPL